jgi:hypothetical protein
MSCARGDGDELQQCSQHKMQKQRALQQLEQALLAAANA